MKKHLYFKKKAITTNKSIICLSIFQKKKDLTQTFKISKCRQKNISQRYD